MFDNIGNIITRLIDAVNLARQPHEIVVNYPSGSPAEGTEAGRFLLQRDAGGAKYAWHGTGRAVELQTQVAEYVRRHSAKSLASLIALAGEDEAAIFINAEPFAAARMVAPLSVFNPELGSVKFEVARHPTWMRWAGALHCGRSSVDLSHAALADLLLDNAEDLVQPQIAQVLSAFRFAKTVEYDADLDNSGSVGVKVSFSKGSSNVQVPRAFEVKLPSFSGIWDEGESPIQIARVTVRVLPPLKDEAAPRFRLLWANAAECEYRAALALEAKVRGAAGAGIPVYLGTYDATRYVLPTD